MVDQGMVSADRASLSVRGHNLPGPWIGVKEATIFTGWVYDFLAPHALALKVAHPEMLKALTAARKKNDQSDAEEITDLLRVNWLPECPMLLQEIRELRRILRYRNHLVRTAVSMHNKMSGLLMEVGASYSKNRLRGKKYFHERLERLDEISFSVKELLMLSRAGFEMFQTFQKQLIQALRSNPLIQERAASLMSIVGVGEVTALTWVLEIGPVADIRQRESSKGNRNRATLVVARRLVAHMMAVDKSETNFVFRKEQKAASTLPKTTSFPPGFSCPYSFIKAII